MNRALLLLFAAAAALCATVGIGQVKAEPTEKEKLAEANKVYALLKDKCWSCHGEPGKKVYGMRGQLNFILDYDKLVENKMLAAKDEDSELYGEMKSGSMPREFDANTRKMVKKKLPQESLDLVLTWIKNGATKWDPDAKTDSAPGPKVAWTEINCKTSPDARSGHAMSEGPGNTVVLFGGNVDGKPNSDTWTFDGKTWIKAAPAVSPKGQGRMAFDKSRGVTVLVTTEGVWEWDGKDWKPGVAEQAPVYNTEFSIAYDLANKVIVCFGGYALGTAKSSLYNETFTFDGKAWKKLEPKESPEGRKNAAMAWSPASKALLLYGGETDNGAQTDTWTFDGKAWKKQAPAASPKGQGTMAASTSSVVLITNGADTVGTWLWDGKNWLEAKGGPKNRSGFGVAFDAKTKGIMLFGGKGDAALADTWELNAAK